MLFYFCILLILLAFSTKKKYSKATSFIPHFIIMGMIAFKGEVGPDYFGYLHRYTYFDPVTSFLKTKGEIGWYFVEYFTHINQWGYQMYTAFTGIIGLGFLIKAQHKIKYLGFLVFIYQLIFVQLGLSGLRQFIAVCILIYAISICLFENQKSIFKFIALILFAATFHISILAMGFVLPFLFKLKKRHVLLIILLAVVGFSMQILEDSVDKYDTRYLEGTSVSAGAWVRFIITTVIILLGIKKVNKKLYNLGITIIIFGAILGVVNSVALHRFNYYFLPVACLILIKNYKLGIINPIKMKYVYIISILYFLFWFSFSKYAESFIPYNIFIE
jgi:hypothetical protein